MNDYDLRIQHNEAVNLACDYIGVERLRSDSYFDGTLGKSLVTAKLAQAGNHRHRAVVGRRGDRDECPVHGSASAH